MRLHILLACMVVTTIIHVGALNAQQASQDMEDCIQDSPVCYLAEITAVRKYTPITSYPSFFNIHCNHTCIGKSFYHCSFAQSDWAFIPSAV